MPLPVHAPAEVRAYCGTMRERAVLGQPVGQWVDDLLLALAVALAEIGAASALAAHRQHRPIDAAGYALLAGGSAVLALRRRYVVPVLAASGMRGRVRLTEQGLSVHVSPAGVRPVGAPASR